MIISECLHAAAAEHERLGRPIANYRHHTEMEIVGIANNMQTAGQPVRPQVPLSKGKGTGKDGGLEPSDRKRKPLKRKDCNCNCQNLTNALKLKAYIFEAWPQAYPKKQGAI